MKRLSGGPRTALGLVAILVAMGLGSRSAAAPPDAASTDANITRLTTGLLEHSQFARHPFDRELAGTFLERYVDSLDPTRSLFMQSDVGEFRAYGATLAKATRGAGDTRPAQAIFRRYLERLGQRSAFVADTLRSSSFDFAGHDTFSTDRESAPRPADLEGAHVLWLRRLRAEYLQEKLDGKPPQQIVRTLIERYGRQVQTMTAFGHDEVLEVYLDTLAHVYDPHSDYLGHSEMESFSIGMNLSLFGIGATLEDADGYCTIRGLVPGGPAARSGLLKPGDRIVAVAQAGEAPVDVVNLPLSRTVELIRGPKQSTVTLQILPAGVADGAPRTASIVRDEVKLEDQQAKARIVDLPTDEGAPLRIGVVDLPSFYADMGGRDGSARRSATSDVARLLSKLKAEQVQGVVLDLRRNGGGSLEEAISLTGLFIRTGPVVQTRDPAGHVEVGNDGDPGIAYDGPLVLLTSRFSASATEILAGALQDYGRALVVGDPSTFGKGTVQSVVPLARLMDRMGIAHSYDPGALKVTISKFYRPSGASTQLRGVASDVVIPSTTDVRDVSESSLKDPLPWDVVPSARYPALNLVKPFVSALRDKSARRIAANRDFEFVRGDIARLKGLLAAKSVSLNEADRRREMTQDKDRGEARELVERARRAKMPTSYAITLENASSPGLPRPLVAGDAETSASKARSAASGESGRSTEQSSLDDDVVLDESERVLADYVELLSRNAS